MKLPFSEKNDCFRGRSNGENIRIKKTRIEKVSRRIGYEVN